MKNKCIVLFSGGLDSRLTLKILQNKGFDLVAVYFKFPFSKDSEKEIRKFVKNSKSKLKVFDCTQGKLLKEYLKIVTKAEHGCGAGVNPCVDCKIFMLRKTKRYADKNKIKFIATGEVIGQRPMSQMEKSMRIIKEKSELKNRLLRPLEEEGIKGRRRDKQISLAKKFKIDYPSPAGGCLLCEKDLKKRFKFLLGRGMNSSEVKLINVGRHFKIKNYWIVLGRNEQENKIIEKIGKKTGKLIIPNYIAGSVIVLGKIPSTVTPTFHPKVINNRTKALIISKSKADNLNKIIEITEKLIKAYSKKGSIKDRKKFEEYKI